MVLIGSGTVGRSRLNFESTFLKVFIEKYMFYVYIETLEQKLPPSRVKKNPDSVLRLAGGKEKYEF